MSVGSYRLEVGPAEDTFALFTAQKEERNAEGLAQALNVEAEAGAAKGADLLEGPLDEASSVTDWSERSLSLFNAIAAGNALDPKVVSQELDAALALLTRLDRSGRHKDVLRLARDLAALYSLLLRWLELVRTLRLALNAAHAIGDRSAESWALHELGSLHLAAGHSKTAAKYLHQAMELQQHATGYARCATRHNLDAAERDKAGSDAIDKTRRSRRLRFVGAGVLIGLLFTGGVALAHHHKSTTPVKDTIPLIDQKKPLVVLTKPTDQSSIRTNTPIFSGRGGHATGDLARVTVRVFRGLTASGTPVQTLPTKRDPASGRFSVQARPLPAGSYTAVATQRDRSGNVGTARVKFTIAHTQHGRDTTKPVISFTSPTNGSSTNDTRLTFKGTAGTLTGDEPGIAVTVYRGSTASGSPVQTLPAKRDPASGKFSVQGKSLVAGIYTTKPNVEGPYTAVATQRDQAGNVGTAQVTFTIDLTPPLVSFTSPKDQSTIQATNPTFDGTGTYGTLPGDKLAITITISLLDPQTQVWSPVETLQANLADGTWTANSTTPLQSGSHYEAVASQTDEAGNTGTTTIDFFTLNNPT